MEKSFKLKYMQLRKALYLCNNFTEFKILKDNLVEITIKYNYLTVLYHSLKNNIKIVEQNDIDKIVIDLS